MTAGQTWATTKERQLWTVRSANRNRSPDRQLAVRIPDLPIQHELRMAP